MERAKSRDLLYLCIRCCATSHRPPSSYPHHPLGCTHTCIHTFQSNNMLPSFSSSLNTLKLVPAWPARMTDPSCPSAAAYTLSSDQVPFCQKHRQTSKGQGGTWFLGHRQRTHIEMGKLHTPRFLGPSKPTANRQHEARNSLFFGTSKPQTDMVGMETSVSEPMRPPSQRLVSL